MNMYNDIDNYNNNPIGSGYTTPETNQHHNPLPTIYHNQPHQLHHMPSPPLSDILPPTPTYPVTPSTSYAPVHGHHVYPQHYQQTVPVSRGPVMPVVGARRRASPDSHLVEPPMQHRRSFTTSSRRDNHPYYPAKRRSVQVSDDDDDDLTELPPNATDQQKLEHQRYRNTLAARRSRKRKELYKQELEQRVEQLAIETEKWRTRAEMLQRIIESQGISVCSDWNE